MRAATSVLKEIFSTASKSYGIIETPRITSRQQNRSNSPFSTTKEYYKRAVFLPYVDIILEQLEDFLLMKPILAL